jgi:hypothetical protein
VEHVLNAQQALTYYYHPLNLKIAKFALLRKQLVWEEVTLALNLGIGEKAT